MDKDKKISFEQEYEYKEQKVCGNCAHMYPYVYDPFQLIYADENITDTYQLCMNTKRKAKSRNAIAKMEEMGKKPPFKMIVNPFFVCKLWKAIEQEK